MASFDELLIDVGELGRYQIFVYILICIATIPSAFHINVSLFLTPILKYRCAIPDLPTDTYATQGIPQQRINETIPRTYDNATCTYVLSSCDVYKDNGTQQCTDWVYDKSVFSATAIEEYGLVCDWANWRTYTMMAPMVGMLIGSIVCGTLSDKFGRKRMFIILNVIMVVVGILTAWAPSLAYFWFYRALATGLSHGVGLCRFVLGKNPVDEARRKLQVKTERVPEVPVLNEWERLGDTTVEIRAVFSGIRPTGGLFSINRIFGRKKIFIILNILLIIVGTLNAWAPNLGYYTFYRAAVCGASTGGYLCAYVLGIEMVGPSKRMYAGIVINFFWAIGVELLAGIAYGIRDWHYLQLAISVPSIIFVSYIWIIPESPRWLLANGRHAEAMAVVETIAKYNGTTVPQKYYDPEIFTQSAKAENDRTRPVTRITVSNITADTIQAYDGSVDSAVDVETKGQPNEPIKDVTDSGGDTQESGQLWHLCGSPRLALRSFVVVINWIAVTLAYYGLLLHSGSMSSDLYLNFVLGGLVEFPAYALCLVLLDRLGRRWLHSGSMVLSGVACICSIFPVVFAEVEPCTVAAINIASLVLSLIGRLGASTAFAVIYIFSSELMPTTLRNSAMGFSSMTARIGGIAAPYIATLNIGGKFGSAFPLLIFGVFTLTAGLMSLVLPETLNQQLPDTIKDAEKFGRKKKKNQLDIQGYDNTGVDTSM